MTRLFGAEQERGRALVAVIGMHSCVLWACTHGSYESSLREAKAT